MDVAFSRCRVAGVSNYRSAAALPTAMKTLRSLLVIIPLFAAVAHVQARDAIHQGDIVVVPLSGEISPSLFLFLRRAEKAAENAGAAAIIFEMNTYGGQLDSAEKITGVLNHATIPTYTYINSNAGSAGALIALATKHIYMAPVSAIGAAAPVLPTGEDLPATEKDKTVSYWSALIRSSARRNGHNPDIGEAFINKDKEVKIGDRIVHPKGSLLTLNAQEATEVINGKPLLADGISDSVRDLMRQANLKGEAVAPRSERIRTARFLDYRACSAPFAWRNYRRVSRVQNSGREFAGNHFGDLFRPFFPRSLLAGLAGWEVIVIFALGIVFVLIEILFFAHSTIIFGVVGIFLMLASLLWAMIDRYPGQTFFPTGNMLAVPLLNLFVAIILAVIAIARSRALPSAHELLPAFRPYDHESAGPIARRSAARICQRPRGYAGNARDLSYESASERQGALRRARR